MLRHDVRHGHEAHAADVRSVARRARSVAGALLLGAVYQDEPNIAYIQSRSQGDGETTELHESAISAGNLLSPEQQKHLTLERCSASS